MALASELKDTQLKTITLAFEEFSNTINDEVPVAEEIARLYKTEHSSIIINKTDFEQEYAKLLESMDQPSIDGVNCYFVSLAAKREGLKAVLSGLGGDELFGGYSTFKDIPKLVNATKFISKNKLIGKGFRFLTNPIFKRITSPKYAGIIEWGGNYANAYLLRYALYMPWELPEVLDPDLARQGWAELGIERRLHDSYNNVKSPQLIIKALEHEWYMRCQLLRDADWASMAHSLELRVPFVDVRLFESLHRLDRDGTEIKKIDMSGVCMVDQNIFDDDVYLFGNSPKKNTSKNISWIDILENNSSLVVGFDPSTTDNKPSSHAQGWCVKLMHTGELMALTKIPEKKSGVVVRDGPLLPVAATMKDTIRAMKVVLNWENKHLMSVSKRIQESTLFVEFLTNPSNEKNMEYYFPDQRVSSDILSKLPADYLLLPKILKPGQRTPFLEAIPKNRAPIPKKHPQLSPISCYYMRKRKPHNIIRIEFPRIYLDDENLERLNWSLGFVAWQHEIGASVPMIQEAADSQCQVKAEVSILQNVARSELSKKGLGTLEVYE